MFNKRLSASLVSVTLIFTMIAPGLRVYSQDVVANEDIGGGSSVFVFREGSKKPHVKAAAVRENGSILLT